MQFRFGIMPPYMSISNGIVTLEFYLWTRVYGYVIKINCTWDGAHFSYKGHVLATWDRCRRRLYHR